MCSLHGSHHGVTWRSLTRSCWLRSLSLQRAAIWLLTKPQQARQMPLETGSRRPKSRGEFEWYGERGRQGRFVDRLITGHQFVLAIKLVMWIFYETVTNRGTTPGSGF